MSQEKHSTISSDPTIASIQQFWHQHKKWIIYPFGALVLIIGGYLGYQEFYVKPKQVSAQDALYKAEEYYRLDSIQKALNGDGQFPGLLKVISQHSGTEAANLACFYAGSCYLKQDNYEKAVKYLGDFSTSEKLLQASAYKLTGDAYADWGKSDKALEFYQKAGRHFKEDEANSPAYLFLAAYLADRVMKKTDVAIKLYQEIKDTYPRSQQAQEADNFLAQLGIYTDPK
ncbi:MAG: tetratricopeptide repeat protein [Bacteroidota bacterium]